LRYRCLNTRVLRFRFIRIKDFLRFRCIHTIFLRFRCLHTRFFKLRCLYTRVWRFRCLHIKYFRFRCLLTRVLRLRCLHTRFLWLRCLHTRVLRLRCLHTRVLSFRSKVFNEITKLIFRKDARIILDCKETAKEICENSNKEVFATFSPKMYFSRFQRECNQKLFELRKFRFNYGPLVVSTDTSSSIHFVVNDVLQKLIPSGIPQYKINYHMDFFASQTLIVKRSGDLKILSINDLYFMFILWINCCGISVVVLFIEMRGCLFRKIIKFIELKIG